MASAGEKFNDLFHELGDDADLKEIANVEFDYLDVNVEQENEAQVEHHSDDDDTEDDKVNPAVEEQRLSQKLSQLSASEERDEESKQATTSTVKKRQQTEPATVAKKMKTEKEGSNDGIPKYLSVTDKSFEQMIRPLLTRMATVDNIEDLRQIAVVKHNLSLVELHKSLWTTYLQSGTSKFEKFQQQQATSAPLSIWPREVKSAMIEGGHTTITNENEIDNDACLNFVYKRLRQLRDKTTQYQGQVNEKKRRLNNFTRVVEEAIDQFVEKRGLALLRIQMENKIAIVEYDYKDRLLELQYQQQMPNEHQLHVLENLTRAKQEREQSKYEVALLKQRIFYNRLPESFNLPQIPPPPSLDAITDRNSHKRLTDQYNRIIQQAKTNMMDMYVAAAEAKMRQCRMKFETDLAAMREGQRSGPEHQRLIKTAFFRQSSGGHYEEDVSRRSDNQPEIGCSPCTFIHITGHHQLTSEQLAFLHRGPTYVPPCQMHMSSSLSLDQLLSNQSAPLRHRLTALFTKEKVNLAQSMNFDTDTKQMFKECFSIDIPQAIQQRALYESNLVRSIRHELKKNHLILRRTADQNNIYYLGSANDFEHQADEYMKNTASYQMMGTIDENYPQLTEITQSLNSTFDSLRRDKRINNDHFAQMHVPESGVELPYLYFLPEILQDGSLSLQPMISSCRRSPIQRLAHYLDQLLRSLLNRNAQALTLKSGADFMQKLTYYDTREKSLLPMTCFATFKISNFYQMVSHDGINAALGRFLTDALVAGRHQNLSIDTIQILTDLVLRNNIFSYHGRIYRHVKGSPLNLGLTRTLGHIYLLDWQRSFIQELGRQGEFYGRYHDMAFLTWKAPAKELETLFKKLDQQHPDIRITTSFGSSVHFLNAYIENQKGRLYTRVYHEPTMQRYVLPYVVGHPRLIYRQWFRWALIRAVRYSSSFHDFNEERIYIELTFLANGYSLDFVTSQVEQFFTAFNGQSLLLSPNQLNYETLRQRLFRLIEQQQYHYQLQQTWEANNQIIRLYYQFDWGLRHQFNQKFHQYWSDFLKQNPTFAKADLKIKLNSRHCYSSNALLAQQAPRRTVVTPLQKEETSDKPTSAEQVV